MVEGDIFREVNEELKREQYARLWDKYGYLVIGAALAIVVAVAGYKYWKNQQVELAHSFGGKYSEALSLADQGERDKAGAVLENIATEGPHGYAMLADLRASAMAAAAGKTLEAVASYDEIAKKGSIDPVFRDFARIQAATLRLDQADQAEMKERLGAIAEGNGAWRHSAQELLALSAYKSGDLSAAEQLYNKISEESGAPGGIRQRAEMMVALIFQQTTEKAAPSAAAPGEKVPSNGNSAKSGATTGK